MLKKIKIIKKRKAKQAGLEVSHSGFKLSQILGPNKINKMIWLKKILGQRKMFSVKKLLDPNKTLNKKVDYKKFD